MGVSDSAADNESFIEKICIPASKSLKYCILVVLGVDNACNKVFTDAEQRI